MSERNCGPGPESRPAVCIHTKKITDSCRDKDCIEDLRVYLTRQSQSLLDCAAGAKARSAELIHAQLDVEPVAFNRNHYCIDITFYYRILADALVDGNRPATLYGLAVFSKRAVLCGEDSTARIFTSDTILGGPDGRSARSAAHPTAVVEVLEPMVLGSKVKAACNSDCRPCQIPGNVLNMFDEELVLSGESRQLLVTLGQFSVIRLERDVQLRVAIQDYCVPCKECCDNPGCAEDPCEMFSRIAFPTDQFFPRNVCPAPEPCNDTASTSDGGYNTTTGCSCGQ